MQILFGALLGAVLASFVNVVALRSVGGRAWWGSERSMCAECGHVLSWNELIPIYSFLVQRGRCRECGKFFGWRYFVVEIIGALIGGSLSARWGFSFAFFSSLTAAFFLLLNALTDYEEGYIFDMFSLGMLVPAFLFALLSGSLWDGFLGATLGLGIFALIIVATRGGMGWGDAFMMCGLGGFLGWKLTIIAFYFGIMAGGIGALSLLICGKAKWGQGQSMVLGPFLALGGFVTLLFGNDILKFISAHFGFNL